MNSTLDYKPAGFFRRMVALFYDLILIIALCVGLTLLITYALNTEVESPLMYLVFLALGVGFYCYFWKKNKGPNLRDASLESSLGSSRLYRSKFWENGLSMSIGADLHFVIWVELSADAFS